MIAYDGYGSDPAGPGGPGPSKRAGLGQFRQVHEPVAAVARTEPRATPFEPMTPGNSVKKLKIIEEGNMI